VNAGFCVKFFARVGGAQRITLAVCFAGRKELSDLWTTHSHCELNAQQREAIICQLEQLQQNTERMLREGATAQYSHQQLEENQRLCAQLSGYAEVETKLRKECDHLHQASISTMINGFCLVPSLVSFCLVIVRPWLDFGLLPRCLQAVWNQGGRLSHSLPHWFRTGWQKVIVQRKTPKILHHDWELNPGQGGDSQRVRELVHSELS